MSFNRQNVFKFRKNNFHIDPYPNEKFNSYPVQGLRMPKFYQPNGSRS